ARRQVPVGVTGPRETVDATVFATSIRIYRAIEADIRRLITRDDRLRRLAAYLGGTCRRHLLLPAVVIRLAASRGKTVVRVDSGAATARRAFRREHGTLRSTVYRYSNRA